MPQILRNKNLATKFQILVEIAANQPNIQQKDIAHKIGVTSQAVSEYIIEMVKDGWLISEGRSLYRVTMEGSSWVLLAYRELRHYFSTIEKAINAIAVCAAIAGERLTEGQEVSLEMKNGLLVATPYKGTGVKALATNSADKADDVGVSHISGIVDLSIGQIKIIQVPSIHGGGSKAVDYEAAQKAIDVKGITGVLGMEALVTVRKLGIDPEYIYGVIEAAVEAAYSGLMIQIVCSDDEIPRLTQKLQDRAINYTLVDVRREY
ncbi:winged helix-turn-helix transcriptional regulator [Chloroflexota bacterium]